jgi:hypothetical protein
VSYLFGNQVNWTHEIAPGPLPQPAILFLFKFLLAVDFYFVFKNVKSECFSGFLNDFFKKQLPDSTSGFKR